MWKVDDHVGAICDINYAPLYVCMYVCMCAFEYVRLLSLPPVEPCDRASSSKVGNA